MEVQPDFRELLSLFNAHNVEHMIVGGYALAFYGAPRFTGHLDILVKPDPFNARRILAALEAFGFTSLGLAPADFEPSDQIVQLVLLVTEKLSDIRRRKVNVGRADSLMCLLGAFLGGVNLRLFGQIIRPEIGADIFSNVCNSFL